MAFARMLRSLLRDPAIGRYVVPIIPDEGRTFGLDALFAEVKIYASEGQHYTSVDAGLLLTYAEDRTGPDPAGGHHGGGRHGQLPGGRRPRTATWSTADAADVHVLFDVRLPAGRRPDLAGC